MERLETRLDGPILIQPRVIGDERGFFCETYRREVYAELGIPEEMVQDNHSRSSYGIVRGMHFQIGRGAAKLVRCTRGAIVDVMVDLRKGSPTYGAKEVREVGEGAPYALIVPPGIVHAYRNVGDKDGLVFNAANRLYAGWLKQDEVDEIRHENHPDSPYRLE